MEFRRAGIVNILPTCRIKPANILGYIDKTKQKVYLNSSYQKKQEKNTQVR